MPEGAPDKILEPMRLYLHKGFTIRYFISRQESKDTQTKTKNIYIHIYAYTYIEIRNELLEAKMFVIDLILQTFRRLELRQ